jgi:hypothetical protein
MQAKAMPISINSITTSFINEISNKADSLKGPSEGTVLRTQGRSSMRRVACMERVRSARAGFTARGHILLHSYLE